MKGQSPVRSDHSASTQPFNLSSDHAKQADRPPNRGELCVKKFPESDFIGDLKKLKLPALISHGKEDQIVPVEDSARLSTQPFWNTTLKVCPGLPRTNRDIFNGAPLRLLEDLTSFGAAPYPPPVRRHNPL